MATEERRQRIILAPGPMAAVKSEREANIRERGENVVGERSKRGGNMTAAMSETLTSERGANVGERRENLVKRPLTAAKSHCHAAMRLNDRRISLFSRFCLYVFVYVYLNT